MGADHYTEVYLGIFIHEDDFVTTKTTEDTYESVTSCVCQRAGPNDSFCPNCGTPVVWEEIPAPSTEPIWKPEVVQYLDEIALESPGDYESLLTGYEVQVGSLGLHRVRTSHDNDLGWLMGFRLAHIGDNPIGDPVIITDGPLLNNVHKIRLQAEAMGIHRPVQQVMLQSAWA